MELEAEMDANSFALTKDDEITPGQSMIVVIGDLPGFRILLVILQAFPGKSYPILSLHLPNPFAIVYEHYGRLLEWLHNDSDGKDEQNVCDVR